MKASLSSDWFDCCPSNSNLIRRWCNRITFLSQASSSLDTLLHRAKSGENRCKSLNTIKERRVPVGEKKYLSARVDVLALNFGPSDRRKRVGFLRLQRRNPEKDERVHHHRRNGRKNEKKRKMFVSFHSFLLLPLGPTPFQSFETFLNGVSLNFTWILQADFFYRGWPYLIETNTETATEYKFSDNQWSRDTIGSENLARASLESSGEWFENEKRRMETVRSHLGKREENVAAERVRPTSSDEERRQRPPPYRHRRLKQDIRESPQNL